MATEVIMPQLGESVVEGTVGRWLIDEGEEIQEYQPLLEVETDKVNTEIPSPASGVLLRILVPEGAIVAAGTVLAFIGETGEVLPEIETGSGAEAEAAKRNGPGETKPSGRGVVTPVVGRIAADHGIDLASVEIPGSGRGGRITKKDILAYIERTKLGSPTYDKIPPWERPGTGELFRPTEEVGLNTSQIRLEPAPGVLGPDPRASRPDQVIPLTSIRQRIAEHMVHSVRTSPQVTTVMEVDMTRVVGYRAAHQAQFQRREGLKLTYTPFFIQAVIEGLNRVPEVNSSFTDEGILLHRSIHIGLAVALEAGLIVPVIRDADTLSLTGLQRAVTDLAEQARAGSLKPDQVRGSTFTITNHGGAGSLLATPIINQPNAGILGVGAIQKRPVVVTVDEVDSIAIKPMCYLSLTFDHRIMDGAPADRFLAVVVDTLENWR